uniref:NADH-ubiquinone oxidoreductase chain 5 n=1 Tax=Melinna cristata TaxID=222004 RepID=A0A8A4VQ37_9ANNE|nr:NADH dehydrogenase subunit 5 [Melinna cristata]QTD82973.1 NADH dehydrogenase subunit 5 [Melinna cristata]
MMPRWNQHHPAMLMSIVLFIMSFFIFFTSLKFLMASKTMFIHWEIFMLNSTSITFPIILDPVGLMFSAIVLFISANVMLFTKDYMSTDPFIHRFIHLVALFILSMNMLIYFPHLITLLLGWDGLGLVSFLLVIYYQNPKSLGAGMITALTNRVGDAMLLLSIGFALNNSHWYITNLWASSSSSVMTISILIAAMTKSAQMPFSSWLPAAMAAPTPVSALVHSSTLVTAGVFLLIRFYPFLSSAPWFNTTLLFIACITMLMAGLSATTECDLKKIIALSTLSQLGVMMSSLGLGLPLLTAFHLMTHALFKALLFICAGSMIHLHHHNQDLRMTGNLFYQTPLTTACLTIANLSLCGMPFLAGFYSKDMILEFALAGPVNLIILLMLMFATGATAAYSMRFTIIALWAPSASNSMHHINDNSPYISTPILLLSLGAIMSGATMNWLFTPMTQEPIMPSLLKILPFVVTISGAYLAWFPNTLTSSSPPPLMNTPVTHEASCTMWYLAPLSTQQLLPKPFSLGHMSQSILDNGWVELGGGQGAHLITSSISTSHQPLQASPINSFLHMTLFISIPIFILFIL